MQRFSSRNTQDAGMDHLRTSCKCKAFRLKPLHLVHHETASVLGFSYVFGYLQETRITAVAECIFCNGLKNAMEWKWDYSAVGIRRISAVGSAASVKSSVNAAFSPSTM